MTSMPITLATGALLALILLVLSARVAAGRFKYSVSLGDGGNADLNCRVRSQANFIEYVPLVLILMALIESAGGNRIVLLAAGGIMVAARISHPIGMPLRAPNPFRFLGTVGTWITLGGLSLYGLTLALPAL